MVNRHSIFLNVVAENIPLQVNRFVLYNSMPCNGSDEWESDTLDRIHSIIVDKECFIKVVGNTRYDDVKGVEIVLLDEWNGVSGDVENILERNEIIRFRQEDDVWPVPFKKETECSFVSGGVNACDHIIRRIFSAMYEQDKPTVKEEPKTIIEESIDAKHQETHSLLKKKVSFCASTVAGKYSSSSSASEDEDKFVFKQQKYSRAYKFVKEIPNIDLREYDQTEFDCICHGAVDALNFTFFVEPLIPEIQKQHEQTMIDINRIPENKLKSFHKPMKAVGKYCIVPTKDDGWLRAKIVKYNEHRGKYIAVELIDKGKFAEVEFKKIRKIDILAMKCPRKMLVVKHHARTYQETRELTDTYDSKFNGRVLKMIFKEYDDDDDETPIVEFVKIED